MSISINSQAIATANIDTATNVEQVGTSNKIIDVRSGEETAGKGLQVTIADVSGTEEVEGELTASQEEDLEALLEILGLDGENAKTATLQTVLQAIQKAIKQQQASVTTCTTAISDYDVTRLEALKKSMQGSDDPNAQKIIDNVDRMLQLKQEIEDLANNQGMTYDGQFEGSGSPNFELNTRVREMGDRIADIRYYSSNLGDSYVSSRLDTLAPAMKSAVEDLLASYKQTSGWGVQVNIAYSQMAGSTLSSFADLLSSNDLKLPAQISKDALLQILKEISESVESDASAEQVEEKLEEKMEEIVAQLQDIDIPVQA